jgi:phosphohistidine phosphatase
MKTLFVLRHAKAERDSATGRDFDRPLAERGWRDAELVGREMRARELTIDAVVASPAKRADETVAAFARGYGPIEPAYEPGVYDAPVERLMDIVSKADESAARLMIVGHNPGFEQLISRLADSLPSELADGLPTAGLAAIELPAGQWSELRERSGRIVQLILPRDLRR